MMPPSAIRIPEAHAEAASAWIRGVLSGARERFGEGVLTAAPGLSAGQLSVIAMYAEAFACQLLDACGFPEAAAQIAAAAAEAEPGPGGAA
jgi:hypothetical protein